MPIQKKRGQWVIKGSRVLHADNWITVIEDSVIKPNGKNGTYTRVLIKPGVAILPIDKNNNVYLIEQFRFALEKRSLEVIIGGLETKENRLTAAKRELKEEAGIYAKKWEYLGVIHIDTSMVQCSVHLYMASELSFTTPTPDDSEILKVKKMPFQKAFDFVLQNKIVHAPSVALILQIAHYVRKKEK